MGYNFVTNIENCKIALASLIDPSVLYYSHIPTGIISLLVGLFILFKSKKSLEGKILFSISIIFSLWSFFDLIAWVSFDSRAVMFFWSPLLIFELCLFALCLYFVYVFIDKKDISLRKKVIIGLIVLPSIILVSTRLNLSDFSIGDCAATETNFILYYIDAAEIILSFWILIISIIKYRKAEKEGKKQILLLSSGIALFLLTFFASGYIADVYNNLSVSVYGLFGIVFFIGFLGYLIVKYKAFNIKLLGAQALVAALIILVGSQFFYATDTASRILTGVTLFLTLGFGWFLIKSVEKEVEQKDALEIANKEINERKEELQTMADSLAQANDQLRKLDNAKTEFISIASHQLRTPVTAIKGFASLILEGSYGEISASVQGALEKMYVSSERLVNLIEDLLNVSRIESGRLTFTFENAKVENVLKELYENFLLIAKAKKFYLDLKLPENPFPEIKMDAGKIRELVSNFIDNALKYTEKGGVTISAEIRENGVVIDDKGFVKVGEVSPYGKVARITVSDTGIGIPKEEIPFLFRKFSRGKDVSRLHVGGTGLGLYVGKAIADAHRGATWVESDGEGKGSRFIIEIPVEGQLNC